MRAQIRFRRSDLLYRHTQPLNDPHAEARRRLARARRDPDQLVREVLGLPITTSAGFVVGPTLLDMLERRVWQWDELPTATREAFLSALPKGVQTPRTVVAWTPLQRRPLTEPPSGGIVIQKRRESVALRGGIVIHPSAGLESAPKGWPRFRA